MKKQRLETFGDAIFAIILTILALKLPQLETFTFMGFWQLKMNYFAYLISFLIIFNVWYNNHNFFHNVSEVNDLVVWLDGFTLLMLSLLPFASSMVSLNPYSLPAEVFYGIDLIMIHLFYVLMVKSEMNYNPDISRNFLNKHVNTPLLIIMVGFILSFAVFTPAILISCLLTVLAWIYTFRHFKEVDNSEF